MSRDENAVWIIAVNFALLSLMMVGGISPVLPELHRQVVDVYGWMRGLAMRIAMRALLTVALSLVAVVLAIGLWFIADGLSGMWPGAGTVARVMIVVAVVLGAGRARDHDGLWVL